MKSKAQTPILLVVLLALADLGFRFNYHAINMYAARVPGRLIVNLVDSWET